MELNEQKEKKVKKRKFMKFSSIKKEQQIFFYEFCFCCRSRNGIQREHNQMKS